MQSFSVFLSYFSQLRKRLHIVWNLCHNINKIVDFSSRLPHYLVAKPFLSWSLQQTDALWCSQSYLSQQTNCHYSPQQREWRKDALLGEKISVLLSLHSFFIKIKNILVKDIHFITSPTCNIKLWHQSLGKISLPDTYIKVINDIKSYKVKFKPFLVTLSCLNCQLTLKEGKARTHSCINEQQIC